MDRFVAVLQRYGPEDVSMYLRVAISSSLHGVAERYEEMSANTRIDGGDENFMRTLDVLFLQGTKEGPLESVRVSVVMRNPFAETLEGKGIDWDSLAPCPHKTVDDRVEEVKREVLEGLVDLLHLDLTIPAHVVVLEQHVPKLASIAIARDLEVKRLISAQVTGFVGDESDES